MSDGQFTERGKILAGLVRPVTPTQQARTILKRFLDLEPEPFTPADLQEGYMGFANVTLSAGDFRQLERMIAEALESK